MANKVFIEINWKIFRKLPSSLVQAWIYGWTTCDPIGVFEYDEDYARVDLNKKDAENDFEKLYDFGVIKLSSTKYLFIDFIAINYVQLKENYNPHKPAFRALEKNNLYLNASNNAIDLEKISSYSQACVKLVDEDEDIIEDKNNSIISNNLKKATLFDIRKKEEIKIPWNTESFLEYWDKWKRYKKEQHKFNFKSITSENSALSELNQLSIGIEETAIAIINQSITKGWKGFFLLPPEVNQNDKKMVI